jgi:pimeloyl-ACP methyl ester carboxylesterase
VGVVQRNHVVLSGLPDGQPMLFAHGFGCDRNMWRHVAPAGLLERRVLDTHPPAVEYRPTADGQRFEPLVHELVRYAGRG